MLSPGDASGMTRNVLDLRIGREDDHSRASPARLKSLLTTAALAAPAALAVVGAGLYLWLFLRVLWRIGDEGSIVYGAVRVTEGAVPYRDFFEVMGPGTFYWLALWFKLLGTSWLTSRVAVLTTALVSACAIYYATTRQYRGRFALVPAALYTIVTLTSWPGANHHFDSNMWALLAFAVCVSVPHFTRNGSALTGVLAGFAATIMPQKGVLLVMALVVGRLMDGAKPRGWRRAAIDTLWIIGPFLVVGASVVVFFWSQNALYDLVYANLIWPASRYHSVNVVPYAHHLREISYGRNAPILAAILPRPLAAVTAVLTTIPFIVVVVLPFAGGALVLWDVARRRRVASPAGAVPWTYWCAGFALFASEFHRVDLMHLAYGSPILLLATNGRLAHASGSLPRITRTILVSSVASLAALLALIVTTPATEVSRTRMGDVQLFAQDENVPAGEQVFVYPYYPMYYFLADVRNPTRYSILMYHINTPAQFDEVIRDLEAGRVKYVLWDSWVAGANLAQWFPDYKEPATDEQRLEQYLNRHYEVVGMKNRFRVLRRM
jgi:hypothetical protein